MQVRFSPGSVILSTLAIIVLVIASCGAFVVSNPYLGGTFVKSVTEETGVRVDRIDPDGPLARAGIENGDIALSIDSTGAKPADIPSFIGVADPDVLPMLADFDAFMHSNGVIYRHQASLELSLMVKEKGKIDVRPRSRWPLPALLKNQEFVGATTIGALSILLGVMVWMNRRQRALPIYILLLACITNAITLWTASLFWSRELALPEQTFRAIMALNHFGATFYPVLIVSLIAIYPRRIVSNAVLISWFGLACLYWLNKQLMVIDFPFHNHMGWYAAATTICLTGIIAQWLSTRYHPIQRMQITWVALCIIVMSAAMLIYYIVPIMLTGATLAALQWPAGALTLFPFVGFALGIARYRLFDLPEWWFNAWTMVLTGLVILLVELILIFIFGFHQAASIAYAALALGWIYFPLRAFLFGHVFRSPSLSAERVIPSYVNTLSKAGSAIQFDANLRAELKRLFAPSSMRQIPVPEDTSKQPAARIDEDGATMIVPSIDSRYNTHLESAARGTRLFTRRDIALATTLYEITNRHHDQIEAIEQSVEKERSRIARDLHDTVGAKLVGLIHNVNVDDAPHRIRDVNSAVKDTIWLLRSNEPKPLSTALAKWSEEARTRLEERNIPLQWHHGDTGSVCLPAADIVSLGNIFRECLTNTIKHSSASFVRIEIAYTASDGLNVSIINDGCPTDPSQWRDGFGLRGVHERLEELDGTISWTYDPTDRGILTTRLSIPLSSQNT